MAVIASIVSTFDDKGVRQADDAHETLGGKLGKFGKLAGAAFAAAGVAAAAYAAKLAVDGVKAAIEDEAAQKKLALTLGNVTGATDKQVAAVEDYVLKTELAYGVTDEKLRPSLDRLVRSTKNVEEAQKLQAIALDVSAGTGKDLQAVSEALAKAHDGNFAALKKLGVSLDESIIKSKDFDAATAALSATFQGQASTQADTFQGKMARLNIAFDEAKETVGGYILDGLTPLLDITVKNVIPAIQSGAQAIGKELAPAFSNIGTFVKDTLVPVLKNLWDFFANTIVPGIIKTVRPILEGLGSVFGTVANKINENSEKLAPLLDFMKAVAEFVYTKLAPVLGTVLGGALKILGGILGGLIDLFANLVGWISSAVQKIQAFVKAVADSPIGSAISGIVNTITGARASGGAVSGGSTYLVGEQGAELFTPSRSGYIVPNNALGGGGTVVNVNVSGALDPVSVANQISQILERQNIRLGVA